MRERYEIALCLYLRDCGELHEENHEKENPHIIDETLLLNQKPSFNEK